MKVAIYTNTIKKISGVNIAERFLYKNLKKAGYNVSYYADRVEVGANVFIPYRLVSTKNIECNYLIQSSIFCQKVKNFKVNKKHIHIYHALYSKYNLPANEKADIHIAVSRIVEKDIRNILGDVDLRVIENFIGAEKRKVRLLVASRLTRDKGVNRILYLLGKLDEKGINYWISIATEEDDFINYFSNKKSVKYLGILNYDQVNDLILNSDYVLQLSDSEGWGYTIHQALALGKKLVLTGDLLYTTDNIWDNYVKNNVLKYEDIVNNPQILVDELSFFDVARHNEKQLLKWKRILK